MKCKSFERAMLTLKSVVAHFKREKILKYVHPASIHRASLLLFVTHVSLVDGCQVRV